MNATFQDLQDDHNELNHTRVNDERSLDALLDSMKGRAPFFFELVGENGSTLLVGFGSDAGCVQYSTSDGEPPYLMALGDGQFEEGLFMEFLTGDTPSPVSNRFCMRIEELKQILLDFLNNGAMSATVEWEAI